MAVRWSPGVAGTEMSATAGFGQSRRNRQEVGCAEADVGIVR